MRIKIQKRKVVQMNVDEEFFNLFDSMRKQKQKELGLIRLGQTPFSKLLVKSKSIKYPKLKNVKKK